MRRRLAIPLIAAIGIASWLWFYPDPRPEGLPAHLVSVTPFPGDLPNIGGLSGIEISADGSDFFAITDRGHLATGRLTRQDGEITGIMLDAVKALLDDEGVVRDFPFNDSEGLAQAADGTLYVSFEHAHRVLQYDAWDSPAQWPGYSRAWRALSKNRGLEALAIDAEGTLFTIPEKINSGATEALVYRRLPGARWQQPFTLPVDSEFSPVGADFGPDGRFYLLERALYPFGFYSRIRVMDVTERGFENIRTVMQSTLGTHGNLEGLSVWTDPEGFIRLTMVSDDNFHWFMRGQIVEYILDEGLAPQPD